MEENKRPYVLEWSVEISWNDGVKCFLRDSELSKKSRKQVNQDINRHWKDSVNNNYRGDK